VGCTGPVLWVRHQVGVFVLLRASRWSLDRLRAAQRKSGKSAAPLRVLFGGLGTRLSAPNASRLSRTCHLSAQRATAPSVACSSTVSPGQWAAARFGMKRSMVAPAAGQEPFVGRRTVTLPPSSTICSSLPPGSRCSHTGMVETKRRRRVTPRI